MQTYLSLIASADGGRSRFVRVTTRERASSKTFSGAGFILILTLFALSCHSEEERRQALDRNLPKFESLAVVSDDRITSSPGGKLVVIELEHSFERETYPDKIDHSLMSLLPEEILPSSPEEVRTVALVKYSYEPVGSYVSAAGGCTAYKVKANVTLVDITKSALLDKHVIEGEPTKHTDPFYGCHPRLDSAIADYLKGLHWRE